jgi:hypothetical protein
MKTSEPTYLSYISYVTLREAWDIAKTQFLVWLFLSGFFLVAGWVGMLGAGAAKSWFADEVPNWVWWVVFWCILSGAMQGEEIKIPFPKLTFGQWLVYSACLFLLAWLFTVLPWWASSPLWLSLFVVGGSVRRTCGEGKRELREAASSRSRTGCVVKRGPE